ncbi:MAG: hypothetical protein IIC87_04400, partial [Chloroflexi bacterium]|nr:hypothetical protein [Chloroflexota bacterium]
MIAIADGVRARASPPDGTKEGSLRPADGQREEETNRLPFMGMLYLASVYVAAVGAGGFAFVAAGVRPSAEEMAAFTVLSAFSAAAQLFRVDAPSQHSYHTTPAFLLAAVLLLPPLLLVLLALIVLLPEWVRYRESWYKQTFN